MFGSIFNQKKERDGQMNQVPGQNQSLDQNQQNLLDASRAFVMTEVGSQRSPKRMISDS